MSRLFEGVRDFRGLVSGERNDFPSRIVRFFLTCLEIPYAGIVHVRNRLYDTKIFRSYAVDVPVVSVGNLTLGGTGKTPMIAYLTQWAIQRKLHPGLISRGYRKNRVDADSEELNDEGRELAVRFPRVPHIQRPDRVAAAKEMLETKLVDILFLDDAFQHRRVARDLDIVLLDSLVPFGYDHIFPRGTLRESVSSLSRASVVLLSRADRISEPQRQSIREQIQQIAPNVVWGEIAHVPLALISSYRAEDSSLISEESGFFGQETASVEELQGKRILAFSGIANPENFRKTLADCGAEIVNFFSFPDHHEFDETDLRRISEEASANNADWILCTMKDIVKIRKKKLGEKPLWALAVGIEFLVGENEFLNCLQECCKTR